MDGEDIARQTRQGMIDLRDALVEAIDTVVESIDALLETDGGDFPTTGEFEVDETSVSIQDVPIVPVPVFPENEEGLPVAACMNTAMHDQHAHTVDPTIEGDDGLRWCAGMPF